MKWMPSLARMDLMFGACKRIVAAIDRLSDHQLIHYGDTVCASLRFTAAFAQINVPLMDRNATWESIQGFFGKLPYDTVKTQIVFEFVVSLAEVLDRLSMPSLVSVQSLFLSLLHPESELRRLSSKYGASDENAVDVMSFITSRRVLELLGPLLRLLAKHRPELVDSRLLPVACFVLEANLVEDSRNSDHNIELQRWDNMIRSPPSRQTSQRDLKVFDKLIKACKGMENNLKFFSDRRLGSVTCGACERTAQGSSKLHKCAGCGILRYCCEDCQKNHWVAHRYHCKALGAIRLESKAHKFRAQGK